MQVGDGLVGRHVAVRRVAGCISCLHHSLVGEKVCLDLQHALVEVVLINGDAALSAIQDFLCRLFDKLPHVYARRDQPGHVLTAALDLRELGGPIE